ncbi:hypothetical protein FRC01_014012, partial [Tulasnella sp. 417]
GSSRTGASVTLSDTGERTIILKTDDYASHTFTLALSWASEWLTEAFQWLGDLVTQFPQDKPFVSIYLATRHIRTRSTIPRPVTRTELDKWIQDIALMRSVHTLDLCQVRRTHCGIFEFLSKPFQGGESPQWPLASLKRLAIYENNDTPLQVLNFLKARSRKNTDTSYVEPPAHLAELVLLVWGESPSEEWVRYIPAIEEALRPGQLIVKH